VFQSIDVPNQVNVGGAAWTYAYNPANYPEPEVFRPERYLPGEGGSDEQVERAKNSYWPFQTGVRKCPGMKMAYQELYLTIARMVYLFDITPEKLEEFESNFDILDHFSKLF
jgi:cytochrome P450